MVNEEDLYIESKGKRVIFKSTAYAGGDTITVPELSVVHRAFVQIRDPSFQITVVSGGISGNAIEVAIYDARSGAWVQTSGRAISGKLVDVIAAGA